MAMYSLAMAVYTRARTCPGIAHARSVRKQEARCMQLYTCALLLLTSISLRRGMMHAKEQAVCMS
eukprot:11962092-Alexandrium_andersonii.AAC.1